MIAFPNAKINLGLNVLGKRADGYHDIVTSLYPVEWLDVLEIIEKDEFSFKSTGRVIRDGPDGNICIRAYDLLRRDYDLPAVHIHLHKVIPIGAGLGGGSSDGACTLKLLNDKFALDLTSSQLEAYARQLGSDCPFFIKNKPVIATGTGTHFKELELLLSGYYVVLVHPGVHVSTSDAYARVNFSGPVDRLSSLLNQSGIAEWKDFLVNDFEHSIFRAHPEIESIKSDLYEMGALFALMSGSGSTVFGIFEASPDTGRWPAHYEIFCVKLK